MDCTDLIGGIVNHLQDKYQVSSVGDDCLIITPFLNADYAPIEIYLHKQDDFFRISDEGEALNQLFVSGVEVEGNKDLLDCVALTANLNNIRFQNSELFVISEEQQLADAVYRIATAIQAISYLIYKRSHRAHLKFEDEVERLLINNQVRYEPKFSIQGYANRHSIPFYINSDHNVLLEPLTATSVSSARSKAKHVAYMWLDLKRVFADTFKYTVILDDKSTQRQNIWEDEEARRAIVSYSTKVLSWSRDQQELLQMVKS